MSEWRYLRARTDLPPPGRRPSPITGTRAGLIRVRVERVLKGVHCWCKHLGADVLVALRHEQRRVAEQCLHGGRSDAQCGQDGGRRVARIVQSRLGHAGPREKQFPLPVILAWVHRLAQPSGEDQVRELRAFLPPVPRRLAHWYLARPVHAQRGLRIGGHQDDPIVIGLGVRDQPRAATSMGAQSCRVSTGTARWAGVCLRRRAQATPRSVPLVRAPVGWLAGTRLGWRAWS